MNRLYLIASNDKKFANWMGQLLNKLRDSRMKDHFRQNVSEVRYGNYLARATFICYWEMQTTGSLAKMAPAITQASLMHLLHRLLEREKFEQVDLVNAMMVNFLRLLQEVDSSEEE